MTELLKGTFFFNGKEKDYKWSFYMKIDRKGQEKYIYDLILKLTSTKYLYFLKFPNVPFSVGEFSLKMAVNFIKEIEVITVTLETQAGIAGNFVWRL